MLEHRLVPTDHRFSVESPAEVPAVTPMILAQEPECFLSHSGGVFRPANRVADLPSGCRRTDFSRPSNRDSPDALAAPNLRSGPKGASWGSPAGDGGKSLCSDALHQRSACD